MPLVTGNINGGTAEQRLPVQKIVDKLFVSIETVRLHVWNIYEKLQVNFRVEA